MMAQEVNKWNMNNILLSENTSTVEFGIKKEQTDEEYIDDKVSVHETTLNISDNELKECLKIDITKQYELSITEVNVKTELLSSEMPDEINGNIKIEDDITAVGVIKTEFGNRCLFCDHCGAYYEDYCISCGMLIHILNKSTPSNTFNRASEEIPSNIVEIVDSCGHFRVFTLKIIPKDVKFGPFSGLSTSVCNWKLKGGKFIVGEDKLKFLNWMQYISPARNISEQNLVPVQCEGDLYYRSNRQIQNGEELLVHFGKGCEDGLNKYTEIDFIPATKDYAVDVFACTYCCFGFNSRTHLMKHKSICRNEGNKKFPVEELTQCPHCKIYLWQKELSDYHLTYCCKRNARKCTPLNNPTADVNGRKTRARSQVYKCEQCEYRTKYKVDLKNHVNQHYEVKTCKCRICNRRFKTKESLSVHVRHTHVYVRTQENQEHSNSQNTVRQLKCSRCKYRTKRKQYLKRHIKTVHLKEFDYRCDTCDLKTNRKWDLETHVKTKHLKEFNFECEQCDFKTNGKSHLDKHVRTKHLKEFNYRCDMCDYKSNCKSNFKSHIESIHLKEFEYKCQQCDYKANLKTNLERHIKTKHLNEFNYKCDTCDYKTYRKSHLEYHIKTIHFKEFKYRCEQCDYKTNARSHLTTHVKTKHLQEFKYRCDQCDYKTNGNSNLTTHVKAVHLKEFNFECEQCDYKTYQKLHLTAHVKTTHLKEFTYVCDVCEYKTNSKSHLTKHVRTMHLKEFAYVCDVCEYKTNNKSRLTTHVRTIHLKEFTYMCDMCDYKTNSKSHLTTHVKTVHLKKFTYMCDMCEYKTNSKSRLEVHVRSTRHDELLKV